ncbi:MAG TPA: polysaccharide biosynthesis/export family protein [Verrucomicrobiae bacterium]|nr:polysaccharide biosynthesis/export family protein [Verrucomicrobiae bacterium]
MAQTHTESFHLISFANRFSRSILLAFCALMIGLLVGCNTLTGWVGSSASGNSKAATSDEVSGRLRPGDQVQVRLDTGMNTSQPAQSYDVTIDENGEISLPLVGSIKAAGLTQSELAESIQANYVPRFYVYCTATVLAAQRYFYISGEVRSPGRFMWSDDVTLLKAISTAGGFTDYANRGKVELIHGQQRQTYNCDYLQQNPGRDPSIRPGDTIIIRRSLF